MQVLPASIILQAKQCLDNLKIAIAAGDTHQVRICADKIRRGGLEYGLPRLVALANELEESAIVCSLGASLRCMEAIRDAVGLNVRTVGAS
jgi:hypothetical protein